MTDRKDYEIKFNPQFVAQKCPVCNGFGTLKYGQLVCHGCQGKGFILIPTDINAKDREKGRKNGDYTY